MSAKNRSNTSDHNLQLKLNKKGIQVCMANSTAQWTYLDQSRTLTFIDKVILKKCIANFKRMIDPEF